MSESWDRQQDEPASWYARFQAFLHAPVPRSMQAVYNQVMAAKGRERRYTKVSNAWNQIVIKYQWYKRAEAFDIEQARLRAEEWQRRAEQHREAEWQLSQQLVEKAKLMLSFPLSRRVVENYPDGREKTIIEPAEWRHRDVPRLAEVASKLGRLSSGLATEKTEMTELQVPWESLTNEQVEMIANGVPLNVVLASTGGTGTEEAEGEVPES